MRRVEVPPGAAPGYPVLITDTAGPAVAELLDAYAGHACALVADEAVAGSGAGRPVAASIEETLQADGRHARTFSFPSGERSKSRERWAALTDAMIAAGYGRDCLIVAVGGGVACDLAGFVAATYMRGVPLVQVPTTLLAMVDASVGGKTALDVPGGKNLVGAFHPPVGVVIGVDALATLPDEHVRNGLVEALKHGAIAAPSYFDSVAGSAGRIRTDADLAADIIERSVRIKSAIVADDPFEAGRRAILNFGHTVGHALEKCLEYGVAHGVAIATGMRVEAALGEAMGVTAAGTTAAVTEALAQLGIAPAPPVDADALLAAARSDKKNRAATVHSVLLERVGSVARARDGGWTHAVATAALKDAYGRHRAP